MCLFLFVCLFCLGFICLSVTRKKEKLIQLCHDLQSLVWIFAAALTRLIFLCYQRTNWKFKFMNVHSEQILFCCGFCSPCLCLWDHMLLKGNSKFMHGKCCAPFCMLLIISASYTFFCIRQLMAYLPPLPGGGLHL